jgi:hypothetical protein
MPVTSFLLAARAERDSADPRQRAREARDEPDGDPFDPDERAANLVARRYSPGLVSGLSGRLGDTLAQLQEEREKIERAGRRQEIAMRQHAAGRLDVWGVQRMLGDPGDPAAVERLERRAESLRRQLADATAVIAPRQEPADPVAAASRRAHDAFVEATRAKMAAAEAGRPAPRPFGSISRGGAAAVRSEHCVFCTAEGLDDETAFLLHSDPELDCPATPPEHVTQTQTQRSGGDEYTREVTRLVDAGYSLTTAKLGATPMIYR